MGEIVNKISDSPTYTKDYIEKELYRIFAKYLDKPEKSGDRSEDE